MEAWEKRGASHVGTTVEHPARREKKAWHLEKKVKVSQSCLTLCDPMDYTVHGILQASILEWVDFPFASTSSQSRNQTSISCVAGRFFTRETHEVLRWEHCWHICGGGRWRIVAGANRRTRRLTGAEAREEVRGLAHNCLLGDGMNFGFHPERDWSHWRVLGKGGGCYDVTF